MESNRSNSVDNKLDVSNRHFNAEQRRSIEELVTNLNLNRGMVERGDFIASLKSDARRIQATRQFKADKREAQGGQRENVQDDFSNNSITKFHMSAIEEITNDIKSSNRHQLKNNAARIEQLVGFLEKSDLQDKEFLKEKYLKTLDFVQAEHKKKAAMTTIIGGKISELATDYLDVRAIYSGFFSNNPLAMGAFSLASKAIKQAKTNREEKAAALEADAEASIVNARTERINANDTRRDDTHAQTLERIRGENQTVGEVDQILGAFNGGDVSPATPISHQIGSMEAVDVENDDDGHLEGFDEFVAAQGSATNEDLEMTRLFVENSTKSLDILTRIHSEVQVISGHLKNKQRVGRSEELQGTTVAKNNTPTALESSAEKTQESTGSGDDENHRKRRRRAKKSNRRNTRRNRANRARSGRGLAGRARGLAGRARGLAGRAGGLASGLAGRASGLAGRASGLAGRAGGLAGRAGGLASGLAGRASGLAGRASGLAGRARGLAGRAGGLAGRAGGLASGLAGRASGLAGRAGGLAGRVGGLAGGLGTILGGIGGKSLLKMIPGIGLALGLAGATSRFSGGDYGGAGMEALSGLASMIPGIGTAVSVAITTGLAASDIGAFNSTAVDGLMKTEDEISGKDDAQEDQLKILEDLLVEFKKSRGVDFIELPPQVISNLESRGGKSGKTATKIKESMELLKSSGRGDEIKKLNIKTVNNSISEINRDMNTPDKWLTETEQLNQNYRANQRLDRLRVIREQNIKPSKLGGDIKPMYAKAISDPNYEFGGITRLSETGKLNGAGTISTGKGDHGGKSYGSNQLSSNTGTLQSYLKSSEYGKQFEGLELGSAAFDSKWKEVAAKDKNFGKDQNSYIDKTHYTPFMEKAQASGLDVNSRSNGVKEILHSTANQYGANSNILDKFTYMQGGVDNVNKMSDSELIKEFSDYKEKTVGKYFKSSSQNIQAGVVKRIESERLAALGLDKIQSSSDTSKMVASLDSKTTTLNETMSNNSNKAQAPVVINGGNGTTKQPKPKTEKQGDGTGLIARNTDSTITRLSDRFISDSMT